MSEQPATATKGLRERLSVEGWSFGPSVNSQWAPRQSRRQLDRLTEVFHDVVPEPPSDMGLADIHRSLQSRLKEEGNLRSLVGMELRRAPWVAFVHFPDRPILAKQKSFARALVDALRNRPRAGPIAALYHSLLHHYPTDWETFEYLRRETRGLVKEGRGRLRGLAARDLKFQLLEPSGPKRLAKVLLNGEDSIQTYLEDAGLTNHLATGRFVAEVYRELMRLFESDMRGCLYEMDQIERFTDFCANEKDLRFPQYKKETVDAYLRPFRAEDPDEPLRRHIESFLLRCVGDPRITPGDWQAVSSDALRVMKRWMVRTTLADFFRLIDKTADKEIWKYRRAFWGAYLRNKHIRDAWVVLGRKARVKALKGGLWEFAGAGRLTGGLSEHSVLLLSIGTVTISEWSHIGACRLYREDNPLKPRMYDQLYHRGDLVEESDFYLRHSSSAAGKWQLALESEIRKHTGVELDFSEYMP